jgi:hypothetical protein
MSRKASTSCCSTQGTSSNPSNPRLELFQVPSSPKKTWSRVSEESKSDIAQVAQEPPYFPCVVVMVNHGRGQVQRFRTPKIGAHSILIPEHGIELFEAHPVLTTKTLGSPLIRMSQPPGSCSLQCGLGVGHSESLVSGGLPPRVLCVPRSHPCIYALFAPRVKAIGGVFVPVKRTGATTLGTVFHAPLANNSGPPRQGKSEYN